MKSTLVKKEYAPIQFPVLAKHIKGQFIVLFCSYTQGVVVKEGSVYTVGDWDVKWISLDNKTEWEILPSGSQIILENN